MRLRPIIDAHLDLAWSAVSFNRDLTLALADIRASEKGMSDDYGRATNTVTFPELRKAGVRVAVATLLARAGPDQGRQASYKRSDLDFCAPSIAHASAHGQLAYYNLLEAQGHVRLIGTRRDLDAHWSACKAAPDATPLGIILSMEGADPIVDVDQVQHWWDHGLRAVGPAHYGRSQYAYGTGVDGPLAPQGVELLKRFEEIGMMLDVTHLSDKSFWQAMDVYGGPLLASHHNCRALVPRDRQLSDEQLQLLISRDAVIGTALDAWMLYPGWIRGETQPEVVSLEDVANHIDHICQMAGSTRHNAIGSDLDGGFGYEQTPRDLKSVTDLQKLAEVLLRRGYGEPDVDAIFHGNWLRFFRENLPE